jgi:hypothetical protein
MVASQPRKKLRAGLRPGREGARRRQDSRPVFTGPTDLRNVPVDFFRTGHPARHRRTLLHPVRHNGDGAGQSLAFGELVFSVFLPVELSVYLPESPCPNSPSTAITNEFAVTEAAPEPRGGMGIGSGPVPLVIRLLESYVVAVARPGQIT